MLNVSWSLLSRSRLALHIHIAHFTSLESGNLVQLVEPPLPQCVQLADRYKRLRSEAVDEVHKVVEQ
jgi:hypothetical protein